MRYKTRFKNRCTLSWWRKPQMWSLLFKIISVSGQLIETTKHCIQKKEHSSSSCFLRMNEMGPVTGDFTGAQDAQPVPRVNFSPRRFEECSWSIQQNCAWEALYCFKDSTTSFPNVIKQLSQQHFVSCCDWSKFASFLLYWLSSEIKAGYSCCLQSNK